MSDEPIRVSNTSYAKYEEVLTKRDEVRKQAFQYERAYVREFGDLILQVFQMKIACIKKKKTIEYCQMYANRGEVIDRAALNAFLEKELAEYNQRLDAMIEENESSKQGQRVSEADILKIKRIYHRLVKLIHPDINPVTEQNEELSGLWQRMIVAYNCNDLKEMEETEVLVLALLEKLDLKTIEVTIPNIEEKIAEIEAEIGRITSTDPYCYKHLLDDPDLCCEKRETLKKELAEYEEYERQLDQILDGLLQEGAGITWRMN